MAEFKKTLPEKDAGTEDVPVAQILFGGTPNNDDTLFQVDNDGIWTDYQIVNHYEEDHHVYMMGIASPSPFQGNTAAFVQLAAPTVLLVCDWTAERSGEPPEIPDPTPNDSNMVLMDRQFQPEMVLVGADGNNLSWRISGTYVYGFKNYKLVSFIYGRPPWIKNSFDRKVNTKEDFTEDLRDQ